MYGDNRDGGEEVVGDRGYEKLVVVDCLEQVLVNLLRYGYGAVHTCIFCVCMPPALLIGPKKARVLV